MNLNDKNIDQLFRDAAQNSDAPRYDHSYWKEMNSVLSDQDKRKRGVILWSIAGSIVAILLISALFVTNNKKSDSLLANNTSVSTNTTQNSLEDKSIYNTISAENLLNDSKNEPFGTNEINTIDGKNNQSNSLDLEANIKSSSPSSKKKSNESSNGIASEGANTMNLEMDDENVRKNNSVGGEDLTIEKNTIGENLESNEEILTQVLSPRIISMQSLEANQDLIPFKLPKNNPINFYAKLSGGLMENYETSRPFQSGVFDLSLNLEYVKEQVLFRTGIGFQATSNADIVVSERAKVYGFGITTHQNNLSYQSIYDIYIPLELGYSLNNTSFGFGVQMNYMLGTTMDYESLENKVVVEQYKLKGFTGGLNTLTAQGYVWLEQKLSNRFSAGVKVGTNLNSRIKEGKYFNESATTNPLYGQLTLRYNLNK